MPLSDPPTTFQLLSLALGLLLAVLLAAALGRGLGRRRLRETGAASLEGTATLDAALFGMFGLLLAFTFNSAIDRFGERRQLVTAEANAISTAWSRVDLLPVDQQPELRALYRDYLAVRIATRALQQPADLEALQRAQQAIWDASVAALATHQGPPIAGPVLDPVNAFIDLSTERWVATRAHPPGIVFVLLLVLSMTCGLLAGYGTAVAQRAYRLHVGLFAVACAVVVYVILDVEYPRAGLIRVDQIDEVLYALQQQMQPAP